MVATFYMNPEKGCPYETVSLYWSCLHMLVLVWAGQDIGVGFSDKVRRAVCLISDIVHHGNAGSHEKVGTFCFNLHYIIVWRLNYSFGIRARL